MEKMIQKWRWSVDKHGGARSGSFFVRRGWGWYFFEHDKIMHRKLGISRQLRTPPGDPAPGSDKTTCCLTWGGGFTIRRKSPIAMLFATRDVPRAATGVGQNRSHGPSSLVNSQWSHSSLFRFVKMKMGIKQGNTRELQQEYLSCKSNNWGVRSLPPFTLIRGNMPTKKYGKGDNEWMKSSFFPHPPAQRCSKHNVKMHG